MKKSLLAFSVMLILGAFAAVLYMHPRGRLDEETLYPDPLQRSKARVREFAWMVDQFRSEQGRLPQDLEELLRVQNQRIPREFAEDAWGNKILYARQDSVYELRSPGPDGRSRTEDDLIVTQGTERWR